MKKLLIILLLTLASFNLFAVISPATPHRVIGYVGEAVNFNATLDSTVLPFDIESPMVARNDNPDMVRGLQIGTINMFTNTDKFFLNITHDKLICQNPSQGTTNPTQVDYRLDVFFDDVKQRFKSATSTSAIKISHEDFTDEDSADIENLNAVITYSLVDQKMYVSMVDTPEFLATLEPGSYQSTISIEFVTIDGGV